MSLSKRPSSATAVAALLLLCACDSGTGDRSVRFTLALESALVAEPASTHFVTATGWAVELEQACVAVGPIYFYRNAGLLVRQGRSFFRNLLGTAYAHPGDAHFDGGEIRGEWVGQTVLNLLSPTPMTFAAQNALEGLVQSFSVRLDPPRTGLAKDPNLPCLHGHQAWVKGVAHHTTEPLIIPFEGGLDIDNVGNNRVIEGLPLDANFSEGSAIFVTLNPRVWLDLANFETLTSNDSSLPRVITPGSQVHTAWFIGARAAGVFTGRHVAPTSSK